MQRLYVDNCLKQQKIDELRRKREERELQLLKPPEINPKSREIV
jgi:hypothetical protein